MVRDDLCSAGRLSTTVTNLNVCGKAAATQPICSDAVGACDTWGHVVTAGERQLVLGWASPTDGHKASTVRKAVVQQRKPPLVVLWSLGAAYFIALLFGWSSGCP